MQENEEESRPKLVKPFLVGDAFAGASVVDTLTAASIPPPMLLAKVDGPRLAISFVASSS